MSTDNTFFALGGPYSGVNLTVVNTTADFPVGTIVTGTNSSLWEYVKAETADVAQYAAVAINGSGNAQNCTTAIAATSRKIGFAQVAIACGSYGWVARMGVGLTVKIAASATANAQLYTTATAGTLDSTKVTAGGLGGVFLGNTAGSGGGVSTIPTNAAAPAFVIEQTKNT
jgi:hypothetical protein